MAEWRSQNIKTKETKGKQMDTENNTQEAVSKDLDLETGFAKDNSKKFFESTDDEVIGLKEATSLTGKSKVTILKVIKDRGLSAVGYAKSGTRRTPAGKVYNRAELLNALLTA